MKRMILSAVAIATLMTSASATCNCIDNQATIYSLMTENLLLQKQKIVELQKKYPYENSYRTIIIGLNDAIYQTMRNEQDAVVRFNIEQENENEKKRLGILNLSNEEEKSSSKK